MEKVAIYVRENNSANAQDALCKQKEDINNFCKVKGYSVCNSATVIGDNNDRFPVLMKLLKNANTAGINKIVMTSTDRIAGEVNEIAVITEAFNTSALRLETLDGSHNELNSTELIANFLSDSYKDSTIK